MNGTQSEVRIRAFRAGDAPELRQVFHSAVHQLATDYTAQQRAAWSPETYDAAQWDEHMRKLDPIVAERGGAIVGYADLQHDGYIDHFFVAGAAGRSGVGTALMRALFASARERGIDSMYAHVSLTAQPLFTRYGFVVEKEQVVTTRGVAMRNAVMRCRDVIG